jgi:hypothetical protein
LAIPEKYSKTEILTKVFSANTGPLRKDFHELQEMLDCHLPRYSDAAHAEDETAIDA